MRVPSAFEYAVVRVVPHVERGERVNAGVIVHCGALDFLEARVELDEARLLAIAPGVDLGLVRRHLDAIVQVCAGGPEAGPIGALPRIERWRWLTAPRSTILQTSPAHAGICDAPGAVLERLVAELVRLPARGGG